MYQLENDTRLIDECFNSHFLTLNKLNNYDVNDVNIIFLLKNVTQLFCNRENNKEIEEDIFLLLYTK